MLEALVGPLALLSDAAAWTPSEGDLVVNFGVIARVDGPFDPERGLPLRGMPGQGFVAGADRWHARPDFCRPVR